MHPAQRFRKLIRKFTYIFPFFIYSISWEQCELGEILKYEQPQAYIVDSTYYDDTYNTPVLTAGQSFILGYTNEIFGIKDASEDNPVIIFDDFTTSSHYVDFPFKIKSSAMKLLSLNNSDDDINCVFNAMQNISYVPVTHERHWISTFAKFNVLLPENKDEQKKIGIFFASIDNLITLHQRKLEKLKTFKKAMLDKMFPKNGELVPEIRFSGFTDPWEQCELGEILKYEQPQAYIVDSTYYDDTYNTPVLTAGQSFILGYTNEIFGIKDASEDNPVIIFDDFTTSSHYVDFPFKIKSSAMKLLSLNNSDDDINCVFNAMQNISYVPVTHERHWISTFAKFNVLLPENKDEQKKIGIFFASIDNLITLHQRKLEKLQNIKKSMLNKMFI